jgi:hypothetical protein
LVRAMGTALNRRDLERAFAALGAKALVAAKVVDIAVYGGSALVLAFPSRVATKDVDAVVQNDSAWLRAAAAEIAEENGWPVDWLNDGVKGWLSHRDAQAKELFKSYPSESTPGLRVYVAIPQYLFAMKCLAMRIGGVDAMQDRSDIQALAQLLGITTVEAAINLVAHFYPASQIMPKTKFGIEEIFADMGNGNPSPATPETDR